MSRADALLVTRGLAPSRTAARAMIEAGRVFVKVDVGNTVVAKPAIDLPDSIEFNVVPDAADRYVSRGGLKLAGALAKSGIDVTGLRCLDVGQSTGGFTDCLLQAGAGAVVGVDVGHGQLHARLTTDARILCIEGINARALQKSTLDERGIAANFDLIVADVSFISLTLVLPQLPALLASGGTILLLVKPQFEVGPEHLAKGGVVRDAALYEMLEVRFRALCSDLGLNVRGWFDSPIVGGGRGNIAGNREFFLWIES
jgi:23S rRNA (cytidine1920-2'-O)/16S rRNA (cytidine1409-2'-O)-methyltransferase